MGHNTAVLLLNDAIHGVKDDPKGFAEALMGAFHNFSSNHGKPVDFRVGNTANGGAVFHEAHADLTGVYAIGGNHTSKLLSTFNGGKHYSEEEKLALLKQLADEMGFSLTPKRGRKHKLSGTVGDAIE